MQPTNNIKIRGTLLYNEPMSRHTSLKVGGPADLYAIPEDAEDLAVLTSCLLNEKIPWISIGRGYNLLVRDKGIRGAIISLERFNKIATVGDKLIRAEAGAENLSVIRFAQQLGLGGITFISGIPGTIGGAIRMNAGAYGQGILEHTESLTLLRDGMLQTFPMSNIQFSYRNLQLELGDIVIAAVFKLQNQDAEIIEEEIHKDLELRRTKHNVGFPSAGSFFKNPNGQAAWKIIDVAGMRGVKNGGALVSEVHSNFLVNSGNATAQDFIELAERIKKSVFAISNVTLDEEVRIVGEL